MTSSSPVFLALKNQVQNYAWGSRTALTSMKGLEPSDLPEAELWIGAHPSAPSMVQYNAKSAPEPLSDFLKRQGPLWLGKSREKFGETLPFLLKILAADQPLSLQVHPTKERAQAIFRESPNGPYVDANHKPEVLCALTDFSALQGFRPYAQSAELLKQLVQASELGPRTEQALSAYIAKPDQDTLRCLFENLLALPNDTQEIGLLVEALSQYAASTELAEQRKAIESLLHYYPQDPLVIAPLLLNIVHLSPGEALYTGAGTLHSYLRGTGVELMSTSDNVLRAGLTPKGINVPELLQVTSFAPTLVQKLSKQRQPGSAFDAFTTLAKEFELAILDTGNAQISLIEPPPQDVQVLLCTRGEFAVSQRSSDATQQAESQVCEMKAGDALLISVLAGTYGLEGRGLLFRASLPHT